MKPISRRAHGVLDYLVGLLLLLAPSILSLDADEPEGRVFIVLGIVTLVYSFLTAYELGLMRILPFRFHLALDVLNGLVLATSPWLFDFSATVWAPHLVVGLGEVVVVLLTNTTPCSRLRPGRPQTETNGGMRETGSDALQRTAPRTRPF